MAINPLCESGAPAHPLEPARHSPTLQRARPVSRGFFPFEPSSRVAAPSGSGVAPILVGLSLLNLEPSAAHRLRPSGAGCARHFPSPASGLRAHSIPTGSAISKPTSLSGGFNSEGFLLQAILLPSPGPCRAACCWLLPGTSSTRNAVRCSNQEGSPWARPNPSLQRTRFARR